MEAIKTVSLAQLDATTASAEAFEFEYINPAGDATGIFFRVLGSQSEVVTTEVAALVNDGRRREAAREIKRRAGASKKAVEFDALEDDISFGQRLAAARLVGWRGISDSWSPANALKLCQTNRHIAAQITERSDDIANFMQN